MVSPKNSSFGSSLYDRVANLIVLAVLAKMKKPIIATDSSELYSDLKLLIIAIANRITESSCRKKPMI